MSGGAIVVIAGLFLLAFLAIAAVMAWQEAKVRKTPGPAVYVVEDAIAFVWDQLDDDVAARLGRAGVRRIIEWEVFFLQGLADKKAARSGITVVAGGDDAAVRYIVTQLNNRGHVYSPDDVRAVLAGEADYLVTIGAVGSTASEEV